MDYLLLVYVIYFLPTIKCISYDQVNLLRHQSCDLAHNTWVICRDLATIPNQTLPISTIFLEITTSQFGSILRPEEISKLERLLLLRDLYLTNNSLEFIEDNTFANLSNLTTLDISGNRIQAVNDETFSGLKNLIYLHASDNVISSISLYSFSAMPLLQYLSLEQNNLTSIGSEFSSLTELTTLLLANNQIIFIHSDAFRSLSSLWHLSLFGNKLTIPDCAWFYTLIENEGELELDKRINAIHSNPNPWICCSHILFYQSFVKTLVKDRQSLSQVDIKCSSPPNLRNQSISNVPVQDLSTAPCPLAQYAQRFNTENFNEMQRNLNTADDPTSQIENNFLGNLNDLEVSLLLVFFAVVGGGIVGSICCVLNTNQRKEIENDMAIPDQDTAKSTTRLFRQDFPSYGVIDPAPRTPQSLWMSHQHQLVAPRQVLSSPEVDDSILPKSLESASNGASFYIEPDKSDDDSWIEVERRRSRE